MSFDESSDMSSEPILFAHRGGDAAGANKENTVAAFQSAIKLGYRFLETDVVATRDGKVVTFHGSHNSLEKMATGLEPRSYVQKLTYKELLEKVRPGREDIPLLEDVLDNFKEVFFSIDIKTDEVIEPLVKSIKKTNAEKRVILTSFSIKRSLITNMLIYEDNMSRAALCRNIPQAYPMMLYPKPWLNWLRSKGFKYLEVAQVCVNKRLIDEAHKRNMAIYSWTVNSEKRMNQLLEMNIDGIMSDKSELLLATAKKYKKV